MQRSKHSAITALLFVACALPLGALTAYKQVEQLGERRIEEGFVIQRHEAVLRGTAGDPWQYRVLSEYFAEAFLRAAVRLDIDHPILIGFFSFRVSQNVGIFLLAAYYYRRLGLNTGSVLLGLSILAWGMTHCFYDSDLQFNTYGDVCFYLAACLLLLYCKDVWIVPVAVLAALNRETSLLIPFMVVAARLKFRPRLELPVAAWRTAAVSGILAGGVFFGLRSYYGEQVLVTPYGHMPGWDLLTYNTCRLVTWVQVLATVGILPCLAIAFMRRWPAFLRRTFWCIVPLWLAVHFFTGVIAETRLLLVPFVLVFIPGALFGAIRPDQRKNSPSAASGETSS